MLALRAPYPHAHHHASSACLAVLHQSMSQLHSSTIRRTPTTLSPSPSPQLPVPVETSKLAAFRKGAGGRTSFSGNVITVFGMTGFLGRSLISRLAKQGNQLIIPYRTDPYWVRDHKVAGELGQILFFPFNLKDEDSIRKVLKYSNVVINCIGTRVETKQFNFYDVHEHGARRLARIAREMGVQRFIHLSALNAKVDPEPVLLPNGSNWLRSKALGEIAVREEFPTATIVRPAVMFGIRDAFIQFYVTRYRKSPLFDNIWLWRAGEHTYKMPVWHSDVVTGIDRLICDPSTDGQTYEFVGPHCYQLSELIDFMYQAAHCVPQLNFRYRRNPGYGPFFVTLVNVLELIGKVWKRPPIVSWEWIEAQECTSDVLTGCPTLADLGVHRLTEFELAGRVQAKWLSMFRSFEERYGDLPKIPLPLRSPPLSIKRPTPSIETVAHEYAVTQA